MRVVNPALTALTTLAVLGISTGCWVSNAPPKPANKPVVSGSPVTPENVVSVPDAMVQQWTGGGPDAEAVKRMPPGGMITNREAFEQVWHAWRGEEQPPPVDFGSHLVLALASQEISYAGLSFDGPDAKGNIKLITLAGAGPPTKGFSYVIALVKRKGIESVNGQPVPGK
jgi:hypothetical protein